MKRQRDLVGGVVPLHRRLQERGQIEIMTTPYYRDYPVVD